MAIASYQPVTLSDRWVAAHDLVGLCIDPSDPALVASYLHPGQFVQLRTPSGREGYFAIASRPGEPRFEFLIKRGTPITDELADLALGSALAISPAQGVGYAIEPHQGKDVMLFAVGTGISPIRPLIWYLARHRADYAGVTLFFGARTPAHFPYQEEIPAWEEAGIQVLRIASRLDEPAAGYVRGYVQGAIAAHPLEPANTVAFVCGMPEMVQGVTAALAERGVGADRIFQNY